MTKIASAEFNKLKDTLISTVMAKFKQNVLNAETMPHLEQSINATVATLLGSIPKP